MAKKKKNGKKDDDKKQVRVLKRSELENAKGGRSHGTNIVSHSDRGTLLARRHAPEISAPLGQAPRIKH